MGEHSRLHKSYCTDPRNFATWVLHLTVVELRDVSRTEKHGPAGSYRIDILNINRALVCVLLSQPPPVVRQPQSHCLGHPQTFAETLTMTKRPSSL